jgi:hypothetical protein
MRTPLDERYQNIALQIFIDKISQDYYGSLEILCKNAQQQIYKLENLQLKESTSPYTTICSKLIAEVKICMKDWSEKYTPYLQSLSEKVATNHNCTACSGNCKLNHDIQLLELKTAHSGIRSLLNRLQMVSLPLYSETIYPDSYRILRNQMALIENSLTELFLIEEKYLIPKVIQAQKSINAGSN